MVWVHECPKCGRVIPTEDYYICSLCGKKIDEDCEIDITKNHPTERKSYIEEFCSEGCAIKFMQGHNKQEVN